MAKLHLTPFSNGTVKRTVIIDAAEAALLNSINAPERVAHIAKYPDEAFLDVLNEYRDGSIITEDEAIKAGLSY